MSLTLGVWLLAAIFVVPINGLNNEPSECADGWDFHSSTRRCYLLVQRPMPQNLAQKYCSLLSPHAHLVRVHDHEQNDFLQEMAYTANNIWLQAKAKFDIIDSRASLFSPGLVLRWKNGDPVSYGNWKKENGPEQMSSTKLCVIMNHEGEWQNANCEQQKNFVCEAKSANLRSQDFDFVSPKCPSNWHFNPKTSACYKPISEDRMTWLEADKMCGDEGAKHGSEATLASIHSPAENRFVRELSQSSFPDFDYVMLGAIGDSTNAERWDWVDGSSFASFSNWHTNRPMGSKRSAVLFMKPNGQWTNSFADRQFMTGRAVAMCKFVVG